MYNRGLSGAILWQTLLLIVAGGSIGALLGSISIGISLALAGLLAWHYLHLKRLTTYLWHEKRFTPPNGTGSWGVIYDGLYRLQQRNRKRRKELARLLKRFRDGAEAMPDGTVVLNAEHAIIWCNQLAQRLLGLRWPDDAGQRIDNLIRHPEFIAYLNRMQADEVLILHSPAHHTQMIEFRLMPYDSNQALLVLRDVTQWQHLENMRKDFVANVSHELRTPLTVMQGYLEMLEQPSEMPPEMWQRAQGMMLQQVQRMDSLVSELLTLSKLESSQRPDMDREIDVPAMLNTIVSEAQALGNHQQQIQLKCEPNLKMRGDAMQMRSAFSNLLFNAVNYTQPEGKIQVKWQRHSEGARFLVRDNGPGIEPQHIIRLTERFYRVDQARSRATGGSGLGLSIVKHALMLHDSELEIQSEVGQGSQFSFNVKNVYLVE